jgi:hypothetical protein
VVLAPPNVVCLFVFLFFLGVDEEVVFSQLLSASPTIPHSAFLSDLVLEGVNERETRAMTQTGLVSDRRE